MKSAPDFDRIVSSAPLNKQAGIVTSGGEHWEPSKRIVNAHWEAPPKLKTLPIGVPVLTGVRFGRFRVSGLLHDDERPNKGKKAAAMWVVKCDCGNYETRSSKAIRNQQNNEDCCQKCRHLAWMQRRERESRPGIGRSDWGRRQAEKPMGST